MFDAIDTWLTAKRRKTLYKLAVLVGAILVTQQLVTADEAAQYVEVIGLLLGTAAPLLAHHNVTDE